MIETPASSDTDSEPLIKLKNTSVVEMVDLAGLSSPPLSEQLSPQSPATIAFDDQGDSSVPLSPNHVQAGCSQDMPAEGSIFDVSSDLPGLYMRPASAAPKLPEIISSAFDSFSDPFFRSTDCLCPMYYATWVGCPYDVAGVYNAFGSHHLGRTIGGADNLASGVSQDGIPWSTAEDQMDDISREGPFDAGHTLDRQFRLRMWRMACSFITRGSWNSLEHQSRRDC